MGESQPVDGTKWNQEANRFLRAFGWTQIGDSRVDVMGVDRKEYGVDSVFYYEDPLKGGRLEGFLIEAKNYAWKNAGPQELQKWFDDVLICLDQLPHSPDFLTKYAPPQFTRFTSGILVIWHHDEYRHATFEQRLAQIQVPRRKHSKNVYVLSNRTLLRMTAVLDEMKRIKSEDDVKSVEFFFPHRATDRPIQGRTMPIEYFVSEYLFVTVKRIQRLGEMTLPREDKIIFYFGNLDRPSVDFVHQVSNEIQITNTPVIVYCSENIHDNRSQIEDFRRRYGQYEVRQLTIGTQIPEWITRES